MCNIGPVYMHNVNGVTARHATPLTNMVYPNNHPPNPKGQPSVNLVESSWSTQ